MNLADLWSSKTFRIVLIGSSILLLTIGTLNNVGIFLMSQPSFCSSCHEILPQYRSWKTSSHREVNCISCHVRPGIIPLLTNNFYTVRMVYRHFTHTYQKPINPRREVARRIGSENCDRCHAMERRVVSPTKIVIINHTAHLKKNVPCTRCHNRVAHPKLKGYQNALGMDACFECHSRVAKKKATGECRACHPAKFKLRHVVPIPRHGKRAKVQINYCRACHPSQKCSDCHGILMPHPVAWRDMHGRPAAQSTEICSRCHQVDLCVRCHGVEYPHRAKWAVFHGKQAVTATEKACATCHRKQFCRACHLGIEMPHPKTWLRQHFVYLRDHPVDNCFNCHSRDSCNLCHAMHKVHIKQTLYDLDALEGK